MAYIFLHLAVRAMHLYGAHLSVCPIFYVGHIFSHKNKASVLYKPGATQGPHITLCPKECPSFYFRITLSKINRFRWVLVCLILRKFHMKITSHLSDMATLPWEIQTKNQGPTQTCWTDSDNGLAYPIICVCVCVCVWYWCSTAKHQNGLIWFLV